MFSATLAPSARNGHYDYAVAIVGEGNLAFRSPNRLKRKPITSDIITLSVSNFGGDGDHGIPGRTPIIRR